MCICIESKDIFIKKNSMVNYITPYVCKTIEIITIEHTIFGRTII